MAEEQQAWWSKDTVALVTGGNKGIGYEIVRGLAKHGVTMVLTARDEIRGHEAVRSLKVKDGLDVHFHKLDVTSDASVGELVEWLKGSFGRGVDILVNNAGVNGASPDPSKSKAENARAVLETNYRGVCRVTEKLLPLMKDGARIVNISSSSSRLDNVKNVGLRDQLDKVDNISKDDIDKIVESYLDDVGHEWVTEKGWPGFLGYCDYSVSKVALNMYSRVMARELASQDSNISVNCICPGFTSTDLTMHCGHAAELGADTAIWLALLASPGYPSGKFFSKRMEVGFIEIPFHINGELIYPLEEVEACLQREVMNLMKRLRSQGVAV